MLGVSGDHDDRYYLEERYRETGGKRSLPMSAYYALKPLLPRRLQIAMRRRYAKRQARTEFPRWPIEPLLVERRREELRGELQRRGVERAIDHLGIWSRGVEVGQVHVPEGARRPGTFQEVA